MTDPVEVCLFLTWQAAPAGMPPVDPAATQRAASALARTSGARRTLMHTPTDARDPYLRDTDLPALALQLYFPDEAALRRALAPDGPDAGLVDLPWPTGLAATQQAMAVQRIPVPEPHPDDDAVRCTYLVAYEGSAPDPAAWHAHYLAHHAPLMARLPGLRELELYRPLAEPLPSALPWPEARAMQRNKVVFDTPAALTAALQSPIRHEMRADHLRSPPFEGRATHYPMATRRVG